MEDKARFIFPVLATGFVIFVVSRVNIGVAGLIERA
jgi:hypothetical protein